MALQAQVQDPACVRMGFMDGNEPHARAGFYWPRRKRAASLWSCGCVWAGKVCEGTRVRTHAWERPRDHTPVTSALGPAPHMGRGESSLGLGSSL